MTLSIVIPAFNEEARLGPFLTSISEYVRQQPASINEVIVVDDGSTDRTVVIAHEFYNRLPSLQIIKHEHNQGKGAAVRSGILAAKSDYIVFMDADGATDITELPKMIAALQQADVAVGNRWMRGAETMRTSRLRMLASWVYRTYMRLFGLGAIDTMCGFKGYRAPVGTSLFETLLEKRWLFDTEIAYKAKRRGLRIINFPIRWVSKDGSKLATTTLIRAAFKIWPLIWRIKRQPT